MVDLNKIEYIMNPEDREKLILRPCVVVLSGVPLSGKTHLAKELERLSNLQTIDVDSVRNEIDETRKQDGKIRLLEPEKEREVMIKSYSMICERAEDMAVSGSAALATGTFSRSEFKQPLEELMTRLEEQSIPFKCFVLSVPNEEAQKRVEKRKAEGSISNIDSLEKYQWAKDFFKKIEFVPVTEIDTSAPDYVEQTLKNLEDLKTGQ